MATPARSRQLDVQSQLPSRAIALSRVGVRNVEKLIRLRRDGREEPYWAQLECFVDLRREQKGAHMSRFEETVNDVIGEVVVGAHALRAEHFAERVAEIVRERQGAHRAEARIAARYPEHKPAPVSGIDTQELYTLLGTAVATEHGTRRLVGVQAQGMTACPCAQELVADAARQRLEADGFDAGQIERILEHVPVATHNQRGIGTLQVGVPGGAALDVDAAELLAIVEGSMSSEIYELMKRSDEGLVVEKAHRRPRFVEDCVREMIGGAVEALSGRLGDDTLIIARQENLETIHQHTVVAERGGLLGELRGELAGGPTGQHLTARRWLESAS